MNKKIIISVIIAVLAIAIVAGILAIVNKNKSNEIPETSKELPESITITQYAYTSEKPYVISDIVLKEVKIESKEEIEKFAKCVEQLKPLPENEMVDLYMPFKKGEVEIKYGNDLTIRIILKEKHYCTYENTKKGELVLTKIPDGLYELVEETLAK